MSLIAAVTGLLAETVASRIRHRRGSALVKRMFEDEWPTDAVSLGALTVATAHQAGLDVELVSATGLTAGQVLRRLGKAQGSTLIHEAFPELKVSDGHALKAIDVPPGRSGKAPHARPPSSTHQPSSGREVRPRNGTRPGTPSRSDTAPREIPSSDQSGIDVVPSRLFGKYDVIEQLAPGGMADVFKARDAASGKLRFIKRVPLSSRHLGSLRREQQIYNKLVYADVEHVMRIYAVERDQDFMALVTDFADGGSLSSHMGKGKGLPLRQAKNIARQVCAAIVELHSHGIIHRDIKPDNVMLHEGAWKLTDFGIAKNTQVHGSTTFKSAGTQGYAAPEQLEGGEAQPSSDVYSFGKVLAFLVTGQSDQDCVPPGSWRQLIYKCTERQPDQRATVAEVVRELSRLPT